MGKMEGSLVRGKQSVNQRTVLCVRLHAVIPKESTPALAQPLCSMKSCTTSGPAGAEMLRAGKQCSAGKEGPCCHAHGQQQRGPQWDVEMQPQTKSQSLAPSSLRQISAFS